MNHKITFDERSLSKPREKGFQTKTKKVYTTAKIDSTLLAKTLIMSTFAFTPTPPVSQKFLDTDDLITASFHGVCLSVLISGPAATQSLNYQQDNYVTSPNDVFVVGFAKCGSTWLQKICLELAKRSPLLNHHKFYKGYLPPYLSRTPPTLSQTILYLTQTERPPFLSTKATLSSSPTSKQPLIYKPVFGDPISILTISR